MDPGYISLISGFVGAIIGASASIITVIVQSRAETKRQRFKTSMQYAFDEYRLGYEHIKNRGGNLLPLSTYLHHHLAMAKAIEERDFTPERMRRIAEENNAMIETAYEIDSEFRERRKERREAKT